MKMTPIANLFLSNEEGLVIVGNTLLHPFAWSLYKDFFRSCNSKSPLGELQICFTMSKLGLKLLLKRKNNTTLGKKPALW
jgi:hypothetical protein